MTHDLAVYIHWPFCQSKCPYCDFNSHVASAIDHATWRAAYRQEIAHYAALLPARRVHSIFFGGGTPSLMEPETAEVIVQAVARHWSLAGDIEITLEANPGSAEAGKFAGFRKAGVNRLSLGVQSLDDGALKFLGRAHTANEARRAIDLAARHFSRFSFDLIYARKDQTTTAWEAELREALKLAAGHLSLYQLTIEPGTQFHTLDRRGEKLTAPEDDAAAMFELTQEIMTETGLPAYEVSNHAKPGGESRHNLAYWHYDDYIGIGPGAHGRSMLGDRRWATENHRAPDVWLAQVKEQNQGLRVYEPVNDHTARREALMMGLRLTSGIDLRAWEGKFGVPLMGSDEGTLSADKIARLVREDYLAHDAYRLRATRAGLQRLNAVLGYLAEEPPT
jgi:oxygen-independent coproporphyrinogen-3 oxidase